MADPTIGEALLSECGRYRYVLTRWAENLLESSPAAVFCMLNPSTADGMVDDPTIRRCRGFARAWGCAGLVVVNLYALRATDPAELKRAADPVGPENDNVLRHLVEREGVPRIVCAWGAHADPARVRAVLDLWSGLTVELACLGTTRDGHPRHPLYVRADQALLPWSPNV